MDRIFERVGEERGVAGGIETSFKDRFDARSAESLTYFRQVQRSIDTAAVSFSETHAGSPLSEHGQVELNVLNSEAGSARQKYEAALREYELKTAGDRENNSQTVAPTNEVAPESGMLEQDVLDTINSQPEVQEPAKEEWSLADSLDDDEVFEETYRRFREKRPDKEPERSRNEAEKEFKYVHPERYAAYEKREKARVYDDIRTDPMYKRFFRSKEYGGFGANSNDQLTPIGKEKFVDHIYSLYPEKVKGYAEKDEEVRLAVEKITARRKAYSDAMDAGRASRRSS